MLYMLQEPRKFHSIQINSSVSEVGSKSWTLWWEIFLASRSTNWNLSLRMGGSCTSHPHVMDWTPYTPHILLLGFMMSWSVRNRLDSSPPGTPWMHWTSNILSLSHNALRRRRHYMWGFGRIIVSCPLFPLIHKTKHQMWSSPWTISCPLLGNSLHRR